MRMQSQRRRACAAMSHGASGARTAKRTSPCKACYGVTVIAKLTHASQARGHRSLRTLGLCIPVQHWERVAAVPGNTDAFKSTYGATGKRVSQAHSPDMRAWRAPAVRSHVTPRQPLSQRQPPSTQTPWPEQLRESAASAQKSQRGHRTVDGGCLPRHSAPHEASGTATPVVYLQARHVAPACNASMASACARACM